MAGIKKPNTKIFNYAMKVASVNVDQSIMIGDNYETDIIVATDDIRMDVFFGNYNN